MIMSEEKRREVLDKLDKLFPNLRKGKKVKYTYSDSFLKGIEYGKEVQIFDELKEEYKRRNI